MVGSPRSHRIVHISIQNPLESSPFWLIVWSSPQLMLDSPYQLGLSMTPGHHDWYQIKNRGILVFDRAKHQVQIEFILY